MRLYRTLNGVFAEVDSGFHPVAEEWDALVARDDLAAHIGEVVATTTAAPSLEGRILPPIGQQEVWAAGVTYQRSRQARVEESSVAGGDTFYDRVYDAPRPELFFKAPAWRVRGPGDPVRIRHDASWSVPEPEIALCINPHGSIVGCTIGNDMSSRDIEGENPLYLPQAKIYDGACALGPAMLVVDGPLPRDLSIDLTIVRGEKTVVQARTTFLRMRRSPTELVEFLYRETAFPYGCVLLTGTGVVPPDDFTLASGDRITISVPAIGTLTNTVAPS